MLKTSLWTQTTNSRPVIVGSLWPVVGSSVTCAWMWAMEIQPIAFERRALQSDRLFTGNSHWQLHHLCACPLSAEFTKYFIYRRGSRQRKHLEEWWSNVSKLKRRSNIAVCKGRSIYIHTSRHYSCVEAITLKTYVNNSRRSTEAVFK